MSDLKFTEKQKLEKLFGMSSGYVLSFSDYTFGEFVGESTAKDIYDQAGTYATEGTSKAKRLRAFWKLEPNHVVGKLINDLIDHVHDHAVERGDTFLVDDCRRIAERLSQGAPVPDLSAITPQSTERDLELLANQVKAAIDNNQPEAGVDRLHTYTVNYIRRRCDERNISYDQGKPLHSLFGEYATALKTAGLIDSKMGVRIIRSVGQAFEAYNDVRNNHSLAHDNAVLNYDEALLIYNMVCSVIRFLNAVEAKSVADDGIPF